MVFEVSGVTDDSFLLVCYKAAAAALKVHEEECQALGGKRQGSGKMSATMQVPRVAQAQPWKISSRFASISNWACTLRTAYWKPIVPICRPDLQPGPRGVLLRQD